MVNFFYITLCNGKAGCETQTGLNSFKDGSND